MGTTREPPDPVIRQGARAAGVAVSVFECPLEALRAEHHRQRQICDDMELLAATDVPLPALAVSIVEAWCRDTMLHHLDEDRGLFPRLRARALPEDDIDLLLDRLSSDHHDRVSCPESLLAALACMADGALPAPEDRAALRALAQATRRHLTLENAVLLPLAGLRLTAGDRAALLAEMRARRVQPAVLSARCRQILGAGTDRADDDGSAREPPPG